MSLILSSTPSMATESSAYEAKVKLHPKPPVTITPAEPVGGKLMLPGTRFTSIARACFTFTFTGDLLDPGETVFIQLEGSSAGFGFLNISSTSTRMRTVCLASNIGPPHDELLALLLDGKEKFTVMSEDGSVRLSDLDVVITGSASQGHKRQLKRPHPFR